MKKTKSIKINLEKIVEKNPNIDSRELARALQMLRELQQQGVNIGPNYNLGSPFSQPEPNSSKPQPLGSVLQPK
jgi:hypothetical protein